MSRVVAGQSAMRVADAGMAVALVSAFQQANDAARLRIGVAVQLATTSSRA
jgi:hypothetical protein